jgi:hypothetical protein
LYQLAGNLLNGEGCEKNVFLARNCLKKASEGGLLKAQFLLTKYFSKELLQDFELSEVEKVFQNPQKRMS